jgi:hypothetical protein
MIHGFSFCSIDQLLDLPDFRYAYTFSSQGFVNAIAENPLPYILSRKTSENSRIILHVINKHYLTFAFHTWLLEKRGSTTEQVILCYESLLGMVPTLLSSLSLGVGAPNQDFGSQRAEGSNRGVLRHTLEPWLSSTVVLRNADRCRSSER